MSTAQPQPADPAAFLAARGWSCTGRVTTRTLGSGTERITWWRRGDYEYRQHFALDLERLGWVKILERI